MWIKRPFRTTLNGDNIPRSDITPRAVFENRRRVLQAAGVAVAGGLFGASRAAFATYASPDPHAMKLAAKTNPKFVVADKVTSFKASAYTEVSALPRPRNARRVFAAT
jgi:sulfoxide reductase catalytic subunit YedY